MSTTQLRSGSDALTDLQVRRPAKNIRWGLIIWLTIVAVIIVFPVYVTLASSVLPTSDIAKGRIIPGPGHFTFDNFAQALRVVPFESQYVVSVMVTVLQAGMQLVTSALAAYALVFPSWRGKGIAFVLIIATLAVPGESLIIPNYQLVTSLGLRDTILGIAVPFLAAGYPIFLLRQAFLTVPREVWEAAKLDGCGDFRTLLRIVLPMTRPQVTTAAMWSALAAWNGYFWPLLITDTPVNRTIQVGIAQLVSSESTSPSVIAAGTVLVLIPTLILVIAGNRFLLRGLGSSR